MSGECDDYLHVGMDNNPSTWQCRVCPEGASCEYANTDAQIKAKFSYQRIAVGQANAPQHLNESFQRCRVKPACLGLRMREFLPNLYQGALRLNSSTSLVGPMIDLARTNVNPSKKDEDILFVFFLFLFLLLIVDC